MNAVEFWSVDSELSQTKRQSLGFDPAAGDEEFEEWVEDGGNQPFYPRPGEEENSLQLDEESEPTNFWPFRGFVREDLEKLSIISMGGVASELLYFPNGAFGGYQDFAQLESFFMSAETKVSERGGRHGSDASAEQCACSPTDAPPKRRAKRIVKINTLDAAERHRAGEYKEVGDHDGGDAAAIEPRGAERFDWRV